jgi:hypothetical protein
MKRIALAASLVAATVCAYAQSPASTVTPVPPPKCEPKPEFPGKLAMQSDTRRKLFQREFKNYADCMKAYVEDRQASAKAHSDAGNAAVTEYNDVAKKVNDAQKAASE